MIVMDALWLTGVLTNQQRADGAYAWRRRVLRLGREIIAIDNVCAWPNLTKMPDGSIVAAIFNQPTHGGWEGASSAF